MERFVVCMCDMCGNHDEVHSFDTVRRATEEARELQRILSEDKKDEGVYYAVYDSQHCAIIYKANGY